MLNERQQQLLILVINEFIASAEPVGSKFLVLKAGVTWSEATVRNELRALEERGYLTHPHTSAGRIPTALGYRFYVDSVVMADEAKVSKETEKKLAAAAPRGSVEYEIEAKQLAKTLVEVAGEAVLLAFSTDRVYYTGLSNLFQKPDFAALNLVVDVSAVFDRCEEALDDFFPKVGAQTQCFIGEEHTFGPMLSLVAVRPEKHRDALVAIVGPQRMDYARNWGAINAVKELL